VRLVLKDPDGRYNITPYGRLVLKQLSGLEFISHHGDYFSSHTLESLPPELVCRMGDLSLCRTLEHVIASWGNVEDVIRGAEEYVWAATDSTSPRSTGWRPRASNGA
jgi:predicted transcriptional regulator